MWDWPALALELDRDRFVGRYPHPFLWSLRGFQRATRPMQTQKVERTGLMRLAEIDVPSGPQVPLVLAIVKTQETFPSMITIGRTANNDVVIALGEARVAHPGAVRRARVLEQDLARREPEERVEARHLRVGKRPRASAPARSSASPASSSS
jgi:hypothetical protein